MLVAGLGSTGSEILKLLIKYDCEITILDHDTVMLTDLNRQFFSREEDIGQPKVLVIKRYFWQYFSTLTDAIFMNNVATTLLRPHTMFLKTIS